MRLSVVIAVYNSHEIVRRQLLHFKRLALPLEVIVVDDCSEPSIVGATLRTENKLAWTQGLARNAGAAIAKGRYLFFTDIDHILSREALLDALAFEGNKMIFRRQIAVLDEEGQLRQEQGILRDWGYDKEKLDASVHGNTFVMRKDIFEALGGYDPEYSLYGYHPASRQGDDCRFNQKWNRAYRGTPPVVGHDIYLFPTGRFHRDGNTNPFGFFHDLSYDGQQARCKGDEYGRV